MKTRNKQFLIILASSICTLILLGGYLYFRYEKNSIRQDKFETLKAIAQLKINEINQWRKERLGDANTLYRNSFAEKSVEQFIFNGINRELKEEFLEQLSATKTQYGYENIFITSPSGKVLFSFDKTLKIADPVTGKFISESALLQKVTVTDLYYCPLHDKIHYDIIVPVINHQNITIAAVVLRIDPYNYLYPLIQSWPTPSKSSEILIVRKNGDSVLFLNELRHRHNTALKFQLSLSGKNTPALLGVKGYEGIVEGKDYRNVDILAYVCKVPGTPWFMVAKVDRTEIFSDLNFRSVLIIIVTIMLVILTAAAISRFHYNRQRNIYRELFLKEKDLAEKKEEHSTTLNSIAEGIVTTDLTGNIMHMNPVAEHLCGWKESEAQGTDIAEIFQIVDEITEIRIDNPVFTVLKTRLGTRLFKTTMLLSKTGKKTPVISSGSPIIDKNNIITGVVFVFKDQTSEHLSEMKIRESEELFGKLFENMLNGFAYCRMLYVQEIPSDFIYLNVNKAFESLTGLKNVTGKKASEVIPGIRESDPELIETYGRVAMNGIPESFEVFVESMKMWFSISVYSPRKEFFVAVFDVITERKKAEEKLRLSNADLERSNKELEQFAYIASHDLQEPLRMISSFTQLLSKKFGNKLGEEADEFIHYIIDGANRMQRLIQDLLSYSRINTRGASFTAVNAHMALGEAISNLQIAIDESGAMITNDELPDITADHGQVVQVFQNLLGNAIKFHGESAPRIHVSAVPGSEEWVFSVRDNGIGIEAQYFERIFIIFQRLHAGTGYPGTGIGLAVCNRIIHRHEGRIWVESEPGKGSVFYFTLKK